MEAKDRIPARVTEEAPEVIGGLPSGEVIEPTSPTKVIEIDGVKGVTSPDASLDL